MATVVRSWSETIRYRPAGANFPFGYDYWSGSEYSSNSDRAWIANVDNGNARQQG